MWRSCPVSDAPRGDRGGRPPSSASDRRPDPSARERRAGPGSTGRPSWHRTDGRKPDRARHHQPRPRRPPTARRRSRSPTRRVTFGRDLLDAPAEPVTSRSRNSSSVWAARRVRWDRSNSRPAGGAVEIGGCRPGPEVAPDDARRMLEHLRRHRCGGTLDEPKARRARGPGRRAVGCRCRGRRHLGRPSDCEVLERSSSATRRSLRVLPGLVPGMGRRPDERNTAPIEPGLVWSDVGATRLFEWRRR